MKQLSVIIPTFNSKITIKSTIESVINDAKKNEFEILVIDNGSTDGTCDIVQKMNHPAVKLLHSNPGRSAARNLGIQQAKGQYLMFLDSDDQICNDHLTNGITYLREHEDVFAYIDDTLLMRDGIVLGKATVILDKGYADLVQENFIHISAPIFRNINILPFDEKLSFNEDWLFWIQNLKNKKIYVTEKNVGSHKFITGNNTMANPKMRSTRIYVYSQVDYVDVTDLVGRKRLLTDMVWYMLYREEFAELKIDVKEKFGGYYTVAWLLIQAPLIKKYLTRHLLRSETAVAYTI